MMNLEDGQQVRDDGRGGVRVLRFERLSLDAPLARGQAAWRARGDDERELTLTELAGQAGAKAGGRRRQAILAELYGRIAQSLAILLLPLLALPLGLAAKRAGRAPGVILAGSLLIGFHQLLLIGQGLAEHGKAKAALGVGLPLLLFALVSIGLFRSGLKRPGDTPVARAAAWAGEGLRRLAARIAPAAPSGVGGVTLAVFLLRRIGGRIVLSALFLLGLLQALELIEVTGPVLDRGLGGWRPHALRGAEHAGAPRAGGSPGGLGRAGPGADGAGARGRGDGAAGGGRLGLSFHRHRGPGRPRRRGRAPGAHPLARARLRDGARSLVAGERAGAGHGGAAHVPPGRRGGPRGLRLHHRRGADRGDPLSPRRGGKARRTGGRVARRTDGGRLAADRARDHDLWPDRRRRAADRP